MHHLLGDFFWNTGFKSDFKTETQEETAFCFNYSDLLLLLQLFLMYSIMSMIFSCFDIHNNEDNGTRASALAVQCGH